MSGILTLMPSSLLSRAQKCHSEHSLHFARVLATTKLPNVLAELYLSYRAEGDTWEQLHYTDSGTDVKSLHV